MKIENQVCSLEQARKLKELGVKGYSVFTWWANGNNGPFVSDSTADFDSNWLKEAGSAFTVAELGLMLPQDLYLPYNGSGTKKRKYPQHLHCFKMDRFCVNYTGGGSREHITQQGETEAIVRATMLIYLLENNLITLEEVNNRLKAE